MRLYSFQNMYFCGIHAGIQTAHSIARMSQKFHLPDVAFADYPGQQVEAMELFQAWAKRGGAETIIVKNGGMAGDIENFIEFMNNDGHAFPWDYFNESEYAANGATTNISMVLPERIWKFADALRRCKYDDYLSTQIYGEMYYLVDMNYNPLRIPRAYEASIQSNSGALGRLPIINWEKMSEEIGEEVEGQFITVSDFERELIVRMNRSGLM